ncbi:MAG: hypothetical protein ACRC8P_00200 [Spiroplasma sp.]
MILGIILGILIGVPVTILIICYGISLCKENNALGIIPLFLTLNILGIIIGIAILYNLKQKKDEFIEENIKGEINE